MLFIQLTFCVPEIEAVSCLVALFALSWAYCNQLSSWLGTGWSLMASAKMAHLCSTLFAITEQESLGC